MTLARISGRALAALAGVTMSASMMAAPASAMSLPAASGAADVRAPIQDVCYDAWGNWRPCHRYWRRPVYFAPTPFFYRPRPQHRECWVDRRGFTHCTWVR